MKTFFQKKQQEKRAARPGDSDYEQCQGWQLTHKELKREFHLTETTFSHLGAGKGLTLLEFSRLCRSVFALARSQKECLEIWLNIAELLFWHGRDAEVDMPSPFEDKPCDILEDMIQKRVDEEVKRRLFLEDLKKKTAALKD